jgi:FAD/FMN-containing dehydrogenase
VSTTPLVTDPAIREGFAQDASGLRLVPDAVARPTTADEVVELLRAAHAARTPVTAAGAQTSYVAGSIADRGLVLSLRAMDRVLDLDPDARTMRVQPGALLGDVKRAAAAHGLLFAPDPTSEEESTLGGAIACNSSGAGRRWRRTTPATRRCTTSSTGSSAARGRSASCSRPSCSCSRCRRR